MRPSTPPKRGTNVNVSRSCSTSALSGTQPQLHLQHQVPFNATISNSSTTTSASYFLRVTVLCLLLINSAIVSFYGTSIISTTTTTTTVTVVVDNSNDDDDNDRHTMMLHAKNNINDPMTHQQQPPLPTIEATTSTTMVVDNIPVAATTAQTTTVTDMMRRRISATTRSDDKDTTTASIMSSKISLEPPSLPPPPQLHRRKSILVTGGAGFVGSHVVEYLLTATPLQQYHHHTNDNHHIHNIHPNHRIGDDDDDDDDNLAFLRLYDDIIIMDEVNDYYDTDIKESNLQHLMNVSLSQSSLSSSSSSNGPTLHIYRGDIVNTTLLDIIFTKHSNIISICHMAARAGVRPSIENPYVYIHSNIIGTMTLLQYSVRYQVQNFVFASSSSVYGGSTSTYFTETEAVDHPISPYAATKKSCELFAYTYAYQHGLNVTALRFFTVYGPRGRPDMAPYKFIHAISNRIPIQQYGDGTSSRDYTYISDIVNGVTSSLLYHPSSYSVYNLGKGNGTTLNDFVHYVEQYVNTTATIQYLPDQPGDVPYTCANITHAQTDLCYSPAVSFPHGIQQTVQWYQSTRALQLQQLSSNTNTNRQGRRRLSQLPQQQQQLPVNMEVVPFDDEMTDVVVPSLSSSSTTATESLNNRIRRRRRLQETNSHYKKIVVSGGISSNAFVGSHTIDALLLRGNDVIVIDDDTDVSTLSTMSAYTTTLSYLRCKYSTVNATVNDDTLNHQAAVGLLSIYLGNRNNSTFLQNVFHEEQPTHVIHFTMDKYSIAADTSSEPNNDMDELEASKLYVQKNVEILVRLLEVSKPGGTMESVAAKNRNEKPTTLILNHSIQNFIVTSSDAVYGYEAESTKKGYHVESNSKNNDEKVQYSIRNETDRVDYPKSSYGASMKTAELLGYTYHHLYKIPISILRLFNVYGPRQPLHSPSYHLFDSLVNTAAADTATTASTKKSTSSAQTESQFNRFDFSTMDYTYIDDVTDGILASIDRPFDYEIFNLGSGNHNCQDGTVGTDLIRTIATQLSLPERKTKSILKDFRSSLSLQSNRLVDGVSCANIQKVQDLLQYKPSMMTSLQVEFIQRTIEWHQQQQHSSILREGNTIPLSDGNADPVHAVADTKTKMNTTTGKLCPTEVIVLLTNNTDYPDWLRQLAFTQWIILVLIITFRFCYRLRGGNYHCSNSTNSSTIKRSISSPTLPSLQQQNSKEGRVSPKNDRS